MIETVFLSETVCSVAHLSRHKNLQCCCLQQGLWSTADRSRAVLSRTLILNSAELGCNTTRATDTALPQNQSICLSHCSSFLTSLLSCLGCMWLPSWPSWQTCLQCSCAEVDYILFPWPSSTPLGHEWCGELVNSHPHPTARTRPLPPWGYPSFSLEQWKMVWLTGW